MPVDGASANSAVNAAVTVEVTHSQRKQLEAVVGTILQGIEESSASRQAFATGQRLNVVA